MTRRGLIGSLVGGIAALFVPAGRLFGMARTAAPAEILRLQDFLVEVPEYAFSESKRLRYLVFRHVKGLEAPLFPTQTVGDPTLQALLPVFRGLARTKLTELGETDYDPHRARWIDEDGRVLVRNVHGGFEAHLRIPHRTYDDPGAWSDWHTR